MMKKIALLCLMFACARLEVAEDTPAFTQRPPASVSTTTIEGTAPPVSYSNNSLPTQCSEVAPSADPAAKEKAKQDFTTSQSLFDLGEYEASARYSLQAYHSYPSHLFLYNAAQAYRLSGQYQEALSYYRLFLCYETNEQRRILVEKIIQELTPRSIPNVPPPPPG